MTNIGRKSKEPRAHDLVVAAVVALLALPATGYPRTDLARSPSQATFSSPEQAGDALVQAVNDGDEQAIMHVLGSGQDLVSSNDEAEDRRDRERFVQKYQQMHRLVRLADGSMRLYVGAENWPFPIPIVARHGAWSFDAQAGMQEVKLRRIGENEFIAIRTCHVIARAGSGGAGATSAEWGPVGALPAMGVGDGASSGAFDSYRFRGYYFRSLATGKPDPSAASAARGIDGTTRFAVVAYPAEYRVSGVMTFLVDQAGVVYEQDLGPNTAAIARALADSIEDGNWQRVDPMPSPDDPNT